MFQEASESSLSRPVPSPDDGQDTRRYELIANADPTFTKSWLRFVRANRDAGLFLNPGLNPGGGKTQVLAGWTVGNAAGPELASIAVLAEKAIPIRPVPGFRAAVVLNGHRLVDSQVAGASTPGDLRAIVNVLLGAVGNGRLGYVLVEDVDVDSPLHDAITQEGAAGRNIVVYRPTRAQPHWWVDFAHDPAEYWAKFSKKTRYNLRSAAKRLDHTLVRFEAVEDVPRFLELSHRVSKASWQAKRLGLRICNTPEERRAFELIAGMGALRSYLLEHGGRPVAFVVGFQWNERFVYEEVGYDLAFAERSPGRVLLFRILEDLIATRPPRMVDFGFGDAEYKRIFGNRVTQTGPLLIARRTIGNVALLRSLHLLLWASDRLRTSLHYSRLARRARQLYRR